MNDGRSHRGDGGGGSTPDEVGEEDPGLSGISGTSTLKGATTATVRVTRRTSGTASSWLENSS